MTQPGHRLRVLASRVCNQTAMTRVIDPVIADLQAEYNEAIRHGAAWRSRRVRLVGYVAFWRALGLHATLRAGLLVREWILADDHATGRTVAFSSAAIALFMFLLVLWPLSYLPKTADDGRTYLPLTADQLGWVVLYLIPQALSCAMPIGLAIGILTALRGRGAKPRLRRSIAAISIAVSALMLVVLAWVVPASNQMFRSMVIGHAVSPGPNELTLRQLWSAGLWFQFHERWAISFATPVLAFFAYRRPLAIGFAGVVAYAWAFLTVQVHHDGIPPMVAAWAPNLIVAFITLGLVRRKPQTTPI